MLVIVSGNSLAFSRKLLPVLVLTGDARDFPEIITSTGAKIW